MNDNKIVAVIGDVHGNWNTMYNSIKQRGIEDAMLIQLGDFGVGFINEHQERKNLEDLNAKLAERNIVMYVIRGNHDNPARFNGDYEFSNLKLVKDYTVIEAPNGDKIAMFGGALSIDRKPRIREMMEYAKYNVDKETYWYDENFVLDRKLAKEIKDCKYIITHTSPDFCWPDNKFGFGQLVEHFAMGDGKLKTELKHERHQLTELYNILKENNPIAKWYYGHFHTSKITVHDGIEFHLIDINEIKEIK